MTRPPLPLQLVHHRPNLVERAFVGRAGATLVASDFGLEVVVIGFFGQAGKHLHPCGLRNKQPVSVIGSDTHLNFAITEKGRESLLKSFEMPLDTGAYHHPIEIDGLTMSPITLACADRAEEAVFGEYPHEDFPSLEIEFANTDRIPADFAWLLLGFIWSSRHGKV